MVLEIQPAFQFQCKEWFSLQVIWWRKMDFIFWDTKLLQASCCFSSGSHFLPWWWGLCTQDSFLGHEAGSWGVSSPAGGAACVSQTQEAPGFGRGNWNSGLGAKFPNILGQHIRKKHVYLCLCCLARAETWTDKSHRNISFFWNTQENQTLFICTKTAMWLRCSPSQEYELPCKTQALLSFLFLLFFFPDWNNTTFF